MSGANIFRLPHAQYDKRAHAMGVGGTPYRSYDFGRPSPWPSSGCFWLTLDLRISVASNSVMTITPGTGSSTISTTTVSTFGTMLFAAARFLVSAARFFDFAFVFLGLAGFPRIGLAGLRAFTRFALPVRAAARFFRLAMTVTFATARKTVILVSATPFRKQARIV